MIRLVRKQVAVTPIFDPDTVGPEYAMVEGTTIKDKLGNELRASAPIKLWQPEESKERCDQGIIKYTAAGCQHAKVGMYVIFSGYTGTLVSIEGEGQMIIFDEDFIICELLPPETEVHGLYFRGESGFFTATYEQAMILIAESFRDAEFRTNLDVNTKQERNMDYNKLKGGTG